MNKNSNFKALLIIFYNILETTLPALVEEEQTSNFQQEELHQKTNE